MLLALQSFACSDLDGEFDEDGQNADQLDDTNSSAIAQLGVFLCEKLPRFRIYVVDNPEPEIEKCQEVIGKTLRCDDDQCIDELLSTNAQTIIANVDGFQIHKAQTWDEVKNDSSPLSHVYSNILWRKCSTEDFRRCISPEVTLSRRECLSQYSAASGCDNEAFDAEQRQNCYDEFQGPEALTTIDSYSNDSCILKD